MTRLWTAFASRFENFGFKIPVLARSSGEAVDGHLRSYYSIWFITICRNASLVAKKKGNQLYYYVVESARVDGKPRIVH
jgi:hypothetical protein